MNMNTNHDKVMVVGATQDGALVMVPENQTTEVQLESEKTHTVTYSQILRGNKEGTDRIRVNQNQEGQQDQAQLEFQDQQVQTRQGRTQFNRTIQGAAQVHQRMVRLTLKDARKRIEATRKEGCRIAITLNNKIGTLRYGREREISEDICDMLEMDYNKLIHITDLDKKTGKRTGPDTRLPQSRAGGP